MKVVKNNSRLGKSLVAMSKRNEGKTLSEVYNSFSRAKSYAFDACREMCLLEDGRNFHICSHNTFGFSVCWETSRGLRYETPKNSYLVLAK